MECVVFPVACLPADVKRKWLDQQELLPTPSVTSCGNACHTHKHKSPCPTGLQEMKGKKNRHRAVMSSPCSGYTAQ